MQSFFLSWRSSRVHYLKGGNGNTLLLCFHGYGESASSFAFLEEALGAKYSLLAIDLPYHGSTDWKEGLFFSPADLLAIIHEITAGWPGDGLWDLLGYSMGGRVALSLLEESPEKVKKLMLIAPDGLTVNPWYWLATRTKGGRRLFRFTMRHPGWFFAVLKAGNALKWVNPSIFKFVVSYIGDRPVREELYTRWITMSPFRPDLPSIKRLIREKRLPVRLLYGQFDRIIRVQRGEAFRKGIGSYVRLSVLPAGHRLLHPKNLDSIVSAIFTDH